MRRSVLILATVSLGLAASTAYLAYELRAARQELAGLSGSAGDAARTAPAMTAAATENRSPAVQATPIAGVLASTNELARPGNPRQAQLDAAQHAATLAHNAYVRAWLDNPAKRAKALSENRKSHEREFPRQLLDLDDDLYNRLLDSLAASDLRYAEAMYRCTTDAACDLGTTMKTQMQANRRELVALIGAEKTQRLEDYRDNYQERNNVASLRDELPDSMSLTDAQADTLADALGEERRRVVKEWEQRGAKISGMANMYGSLLYPSTAQGAEQRVAEVTEYQRRLRDRAAQVLTSEQLEIYTKQQEQMLDIARGSWEYEEQAAATQAAIKN